MENEKHIVLFDGECTFCAFWVKFILKRDKKDQFLFGSLQSDKGKELLAEYSVSKKVDSVVLISDDKAFIKSNAVFKIFNLLGGWRKGIIILKIFPRFIRDFVYDIIARLRYKLFKRKACELHLDMDYKQKFI